MSTSVTDQVKFGEMLDAWAQVKSQTSSDVARWEATLRELADEESSLREHGRWNCGAADYLSVLEKQRDEVLHSRIIAWLLDPCAPHGFGTGMLSRILEAIGAAPRESLAQARVQCEVSLGAGRLDIAVTAPGLYLVIENKVDAEEGDGQCEYYYDHTRRSGTVFILLSPDRRQTQSERPEVRNAFKPLSYGDLRKILQEALKSARPDASGRAVAEDYLRTLEKEFP